MFEIPSLVLLDGQTESYSRQTEGSSSLCTVLILRRKHLDKEVIEKVNAPFSISKIWTDLIAYRCVFRSCVQRRDYNQFITKIGLEHMAQP